MFRKNLLKTRKGLLFKTFLHKRQISQLLIQKKNQRTLEKLQLLVNHQTNSLKSLTTTKEFKSKAFFQFQSSLTKLLKEYLIFQLLQMLRSLNWKLKSHHLSKKLAILQMTLFQIKKKRNLLEACRKEILKR